MKSSKAFQQAFGKDDVTQGYRGPARKMAEAGLPVEIIRSSGCTDTKASPAQWGLVSVILEAYNCHHELTLRPDDVWQAIVTQLSYYVNGNAEALRDRFVDFQGKKTLVIEMGGSLFTADYGMFARRMVDENIVKNIRDPSIASWLLPSFSTTTETDRIAASVSVMSTLQAYFEYVCCLCCGIPKVTLLGAPEDWEQLRGKIDRLPEFDLEAQHMTAWHALLAPVLDEFVRSARGEPDIRFWDRVCSHHGGGSGPSYLSGWVTVFAAFTHKGVWQGTAGWSGGQNAPWPMIDLDKLPIGVLAVPVLVDDNGVQYDTHMLAGQFAFDLCNDGTGLQPRTDWCIASTAKPKAKPREYVHGETRTDA